MAEAIDHVDTEDRDERSPAEKRESTLAAFGEEMAQLRSEAIRNRKACEIEEEWLQDEEFYEGIDDANRHESNAFRSKPANLETLGDEESLNRPTGSTVFFNMIRAYVDAASARVSDMLLPTDDRGWSIRPTPVPDMVEVAEAQLTKEELKYVEEMSGGDPATLQLNKAKAIKSKMPERIQGQIDGAMPAEGGQPAPGPQPAPQPGQPGAAPGQPTGDVMQGEAPTPQGPDAEMSEGAQLTYIEAADSIAAAVAEANAKAVAAEKRIEDWHVECAYHATMRKVIGDSARIGSGVLKGPIPENRKQIAYDKDAGTVSIKDVMKPGSYWVDPWNCFPDLGGGENIHDGQYHWERDELSARKLSALRFQPGYYADQIQKVLQEGPHTAVAEWDEEADGKAAQMGLKRRQGLSKIYQIWYGYVFAEVQVLQDLGIDLPIRPGMEESESEDEDMQEDYIPIAIVMCNNRIIKADLNHLDTGEFPYDYMVWQTRAGLPFGIGVARQGRVAQRVINSAARAMMDNAGMSAGGMWAYIEDVLEPLDGEYAIAPRKGWFINPDATKEQIENAFQFFSMDSNQSDLQALLELGMRMFEDVTGLPMLLQGQQGSAPDTVGGMTMLSNNASSVMRRIARLFDDLVTEPHVRRYYAYLLQYGEDDEKGDFVIDARGSSALVERDLNNQALQQVGAMILNPVFGKDPKKWMDEYLRANRLDPKKLDYDDDDWKQLVEQLAASAQKGDSSVEVAQVRAEALLKQSEMRAESDDKDREIDQARLALQRESEEKNQAIQAQREDQDRQMTQAFKALEQSLAEMTLESNERLAGEKIKSGIAETIMKLKTQLQMQADGTGGQVAEPPIEPAGRAPEGQAYQK